MAVCDGRIVWKLEDVGERVNARTSFIKSGKRFVRNRKKTFKIPNTVSWTHEWEVDQQRPKDQTNLGDCDGSQFGLTINGGIKIL